MFLSLRLTTLKHIQGPFAFAVNHLKCPHLHDTELQLVFQVRGMFSLTTEGSF